MLARGGQLAGEQVFTDVYWDAKGCGLTERDWWLRRRAGRWELKASIYMYNRRALFVYIYFQGGEVLRGV